MQSVEWNFRKNVVYKFLNVHQLSIRWSFWFSVKVVETVKVWKEWAENSNSKHEEWRISSSQITTSTKTTGTIFLALPKEYNKNRTELNTFDITSTLYQLVVGGERI